MVVIYDSMNKLVWIDGQSKSKTGTRTQKNYGRDAKNFSNNSQARAYAIRLGKEKGMKVYDKYFGKTLVVKKQIQRKPKNPFDIDFGF